MSAIFKDPLLTLRALAIGDLDRIMPLEQVSYEFPWSEGIFRDCFKVGYSIWGYELDRQLIGYAVMSVAAGEAHLLNITIDETYRGQGLAQRLICRIQTLAGEKGADTLFLEVRASNRVAIHLYTKMGFNEIGCRRGYYPAAGGRENALLFAKALGEGD